MRRHFHADTLIRNEGVGGSNPSCGTKSILLRSPKAPGITINPSLKTKLNAALRRLGYAQDAMIVPRWANRLDELRRGGEVVQLSITRFDIALDGWAKPRRLTGG